MAETAEKVSIAMVGPLIVSGPGGVVLTPTGAKNQALIALLALSPGMSRSRRWIEDKLWSTFGAEQASANLRQALTKLRAALGDASGILLSDRLNISLDPARVSVDVLQPDLRLDQPRDLLEGLDVRDPEFEDWLREERAQLRARYDAVRPSEARGILINCRADGHGSATSALIGEVLANQIGENIAEHVRAWRQSGRPIDAGKDDHRDLDVSCDLLDQDGNSTVFVRVGHAPSGKILYSKLHKLDGPDDILGTSRDIATLVFEAADRVVGKLPLMIENARPEARATALSRLAMYRMFSFEPDALREADSLLRQAHDVDNNGLYLGWRSLIRSIQFIELLETNPDALKEEAEALNHQALETGADNALVQALISQVRVMTLGDAAGGIDLAEQAVARNPSNGFGWQALAAASMLAGRPEDALRHSEHGRAIARFSPFKHWWDLYHCIISVACGNPHQAIEAGEAAARAAPSFRPAHRHLLALYAMDGQFDKAQETATRLTRIEPGFTLDRILNDDTYPVRTLRNTGMLEPIRALL
ncbi:transcriptional regulator [Primorskyibacter sedentarius]|uniref:AfsR/SARP family transcriptional regulator n=1 Tax=Primorskyibacter sedentarius TaxID=745311 RepID=UPI003EBECB62